MITFALLLLSGSVALTLWRLWKGPDIPNRIMALEMLTTLLMGMTAIYVLFVQESVLLDVIGALALVSFLSTVAYAKHLEDMIESKKGGEDE